MAHDHYDVVILGGGLAGGCLARQLHMEAPALRTLVVEKRPHPVPEAAFKVGESSVEIGAHYFSKRLGLEPHLRSAQLEKLGLRYFFPAWRQSSAGAARRARPAAVPPVPSFQLDRGRLENMLLRSNAELGVEVAHGCRIQNLTLAGGGSAAADGHRVTFDAAEGARTVTARWVVDASGRAGLIKRQLGLARPSTHGANAAWWRVKPRVRSTTGRAIPNGRRACPQVCAGRARCI